MNQLENSEKDNDSLTPVELKHHSGGKRLLSILLHIYFYAIIICVLHFCRRIFITERFEIPTESMAPTLIPGDRVWVNKLVFGGRLYYSFNFEDHAPLKCFRLPGLRKIRPGDIICFNYPHGYDDNDKIEFKINYVYCKRVLGTPGDRIGAVDGHVWNDKVLRPIGLKEEQERLRWMFDSVFAWNKCYDVLPEAGMGWNIKNWGPLIVPAKGVTVQLDEYNRRLYRQVIEYETNETLNTDISEYTFKSNYYFAVGDNSMNSNDSRYWGFIPEKYIIGIVGKKVRHNPYDIDLDYLYEK